MYKATPITKKACSSPAKMNMGLVYGEADAADSFLDIGAIVGAAAKGEEKAPANASISEPEEEKVDYSEKFKEMGENLKNFKIDLDLPPLDLSFGNKS